MSLMIWLGANFEAYTLGHTSGQLAGLPVLSWVHLGGAQMLQNVHNGPHVGGMYGPKYKLRNKPLTKSLGPLFYEKWSKATR
jgi:hypothetical protein